MHKFEITFYIISSDLDESLFVYMNDKKTANDKVSELIESGFSVDLENGHSIEQSIEIGNSFYRMDVEVCKSIRDVIEVESYLSLFSNPLALSAIDMAQEYIDKLLIR